MSLLSIRGAREHNLKNISIDIPRDKFIVITGVSGSGKSSLAFDTIYAEGQRRYVESLSAYARQFLEMMQKPDVDSIEGLSPAISIDQKTTSKNPRSTVGTVTEIYDYLRLLFARVGVPYSPATGLPIESQTVSQMVDKLMSLEEGTKLYLLAPIVRGRKGEYKKELLELRKKGFQRVKIDGTIYELDSTPALDKNLKHDIEVVVDRIAIKAGLERRLAESIEAGLGLSGGILYAEVVEGEGARHEARGEKEDEEVVNNISSSSSRLAPRASLLTFSSTFACPVSGFTIEEIEPRLFSFNSPHGACPHCDGLGVKAIFEEALIVPDASLSLREGAIKPWANAWEMYYMQMLEGVAKHYKVSLSTPFKDLPAPVKQAMLYGTTEAIPITYEDSSRTFTTNKPFIGVIPSLEKRYKETESPRAREEISRYQTERPCEVCKGDRLKPEALCVKIDGMNIAQLTHLSLIKTAAWFEQVEAKLTPKQQEIAVRIVKEIRERLQFLLNVGLEYLTLARSSATLSGGESQRIRLASQIGSGLSGVLYVLDEPSIGLHQRDNDRLLTTLRRLRDLGNTVLVVEHDEDAMRQADYLVDMGLGAGKLGGTVIAAGTPEQVMANEESLTAAYLSGRRGIAVPAKRRKGNGKNITITGATANNLKNITASIPLGTFTAVTGVSGSGKSSLIIDTLYPALMQHLHDSRIEAGAYKSITGLEHIDKVIDIDQSPIGRTPRSNPVTYIGVFDKIRDWFAGIPEAKARGYKTGRFSFNVKGGRCEACQGDGVQKIEMHFLPDVYVTCDQCNGKRYNRETLEVQYKGKSIADVLQMSIDDGVEFFQGVPAIAQKFSVLQQVGLGYIQLGQTANTLSGGEAQRVKLAKELSKRSTGKTLYILDEPTTGLHVADVEKLLEVLHTFVEQGNTVLVIEHNLDVIKTADWILDIGSEGGDKGGEVIAVGTPEQVAAVEASFTGVYLRGVLGKNGGVVEGVGKKRKAS